MDKSGNDTGSDKQSDSKYTLKVKLTDVLIDWYGVLREKSRMIPRISNGVVRKMEVKQGEDWESYWIWQHEVMDDTDR